MKEPVLIIGLIGSIIVGALQQINDSGVVNGSGLVWVGALITIIPIVIAAIQRTLVTPVAAPKLPIGTPVTTPSGDAAIVTTIAARPVGG